MSLYFRTMALKDKIQCSIFVGVTCYFHLVWCLLVTEWMPNAYFTHPVNVKWDWVTLADVIFMVNLQLTSYLHEYVLVLKLTICASFHFGHESNPAQRYVHINSAKPLTALSDLFKKALQEDKPCSLHYHLGKKTFCILLKLYHGELTIQSSFLLFK